MILVDTSAWIEYLRGTGSKVHYCLREYLSSQMELATTEVVVMELLAGARSPKHSEQLRQLIMSCHLLPIQGLNDYEMAAAIYRSCRSQGYTVRKVVDCLIATVAIRCHIPLLQADRDFDAMACCTTLRLSNPAQLMDVDN
ncbi:MAG: type II toxin-antitoxin system VapC family toxin [Candidatus Dormibacteraceae bacterium]